MMPILNMESIHLDIYLLDSKNGISLFAMLDYKGQGFQKIKLQSNSVLMK